MHLENAFIQRDLHCMQCISVHAFAEILSIETLQFWLSKLIVNVTNNDIKIELNVKFWSKIFFAVYGGACCHKREPPADSDLLLKYICLKYVT